VSTHRTSGERMERALLTAGRLTAVCALLLFGLAGCAHKQVRVHIPVAYPVDLEAMSSTEEGDIEPVPEPEIAPLQWPEPPRPPVRRRPPTPSEAEAPNQPGSEPAPELAIGPLTTGGDSSPQSQQQARDLIGSVDHRIASLPARVADQERGQIRRVRNFLEQAKQALNTGDAEGAINVANKAKQIMDEVERR
jgi:hypothetical protein